ncbi:hypothetical protein BJX70DRAFT_360635 [Aspergillus crustosus]
MRRIESRNHLALSLQLHVHDFSLDILHVVETHQATHRSQARSCFPYVHTYLYSSKYSTRSIFAFNPAITCLSFLQVIGLVLHGL